MLPVELALDFDYTRVDTARADTQQLTEDIFTLFPLVIVGRTRNPHHRELLRTMSLYIYSPPPLVIEVDQRKDVAILVPLLNRLLDTDVMPQIIVNGHTAADYTKRATRQASGDLERYFQDDGITLSHRN
jgi:hypothetical protein